MNDEIRVNRAQVTSQSKSEYHEPQPQQAEVRRSYQQNSKMPWVVLAVVVVILIVVGVLFRSKMFGNGRTNGMSGVQSTMYQAVFLTNGQVYFGKISDKSSDYVTLNDIYYLQVVQPPQLQGTPAQGQPAAAPTSGQPQISLVKLGNELHGPVDEMHISRTQILFYEDLKDDGNVVKAIQNYKANPTAPVPAK